MPSVSIGSDLTSSTSAPLVTMPLTGTAASAGPSSLASIPSGSESASTSANSGSTQGSGSRLKATHHLSSGGLSGFVSAVSLQPLDLLKTRVQQAYAVDAESKLVKGAKRRKIAITPVVKQVLRDDGVTGLWRGTVPTVVRNVPGAALYFYSLSTIRTYLTGVPYFAIPPASRPSAVVADSVAALSPSTVPFPPLDTASSTLFANRPLSSDGAGSSTSSLSKSTSRSTSTSSSTSLTLPPSSALPRLSPQGNLLAGAIGRSSVGFIMNPITVLKARYESSAYAEYRHRSMISALRNIVRQHGVKGLFQGFTATAARDAPYAGLYLVFYEKGKEVAGRIKPEWGIPYALQHSSSGAFAAILATLLTSPADVVKTRMQVNSSTHATLRSAVRRVYADRGLAGFFAGSSLRISRKAASSAISWTVYEALLLFLRDRQGEGAV